MKQLMPPPILQFFDANGAPLAGGKLYSYQAGGSTPLATFTDATGGTPNTNPIILDANGECVVWMGAAAYKFVLTDSLDVLQWTRDSVQFIPDGSIVTIMLANGSVTVAKMDLSALVSANLPDQVIDTPNIKTGAIIGDLIPDASIAPAKLLASTPIAFQDVSAPRYGDGPSAFPIKTWTAPTLVGSADTPPVGDGLGVAWSPNGKMLAVAENNTDFVALYSRFGNELRKLSPGFLDPGGAATKALAWSPDGQYLIVMGTGGSYLFQKLGNAFAQQKWINNATPDAVAWSPNGDYIATTFASGNNLSIVKRTDASKNHIVCDWNTTAGQSIPASTDTVVKFDNAVEDNYPSGSTLGGTSWEFFCKRTNRFTVMAYVQFTDALNSQFVSPDTVELKLYKDGVFYRNLDFRIVYGAIAPNPAVTGGTTVSLSADTALAEGLQIVVKQTHSGAVVLSSNNTKVWVSITEAPGYDKLSIFTGLSAPASLPSSATKSVAWSPDGMFVAFGTSEIQYTFTIAASTVNAFATYTNNGITFTVVTSITSGTVLVAHGSGASDPSGVLTKVAGVGPTTIAFSAVASPVGVVIYQRTGDTFAKCTDPAAAPTGSVNGLAWSPDGLRLTCVHANAPFITTYYRSSVTSTTFTKVPSNPNTLPTGNGNACAYNSTGSKLAVAHDTSPFLTIYTVAGSGAATTFTKDTNPATLPSGNGKSVSWTPDSQFLSVGHVSSPYVTNYKTSGTFDANAVVFVKEVDLV